jgi:hypothetical protein
MPGHQHTGECGHHCGWHATTFEVKHPWNDPGAQPPYTAPNALSAPASLGDQLELPEIPTRPPLAASRRVNDARGSYANVGPSGNISHADLSVANLYNLDMRDACFRKCSLADVDFRYSNLTGACFKDCDLTGADFTGADLNGATFDDCHSNQTTYWSKNCHSWSASTLTASQVDGLRDHYREEWRAPWICADCDADENECTCHNCEQCGNHRDQCECCSRCERGPDDCECCSECDSLREDCSCDGEDGDERRSVYPYAKDILDVLEWPVENARNALVFGVELEVLPTGTNKQHTLVSALGGARGERFILKADASIAGGVEIVTLPYTLDQHKTLFDWSDFLAPLKNIAKSGSGTEKCGLHIHINRAALSALTVGKMLCFANSENLHDLMDIIAQRPANSYCARYPGKKLTAGKKNSDSREMVNVQDNTVELRMFRGNTRPERVLKNLEFAHALVQYCRAASMQDIESPEHFTKWLITNRGHYPKLVNFLIEKQASDWFMTLARETDTPTQEET